MERRVDQADHDRQSGHGGEDALEVALLERLELGHRRVELLDLGLLLRGQLLARGELCLGARRRVGDQDRAAHDRQARTLAEHVLGAAETDALGAVGSSLSGFLGLVGVGPDHQAADLVRPLEDLLQILLILEPGGDRRQRAEEDLARRAVEADEVAFLDRHAICRRGLGRVIDFELGAARDARLADLAGDDRGVRGRAALGGQDALSYGHAVEVVRRRLLANEDDLLALLDGGHSGIRAEDDLADGGAGRGVEALGHPLGGLAGVAVELVAQELVHLGGLDASDCLFLGDQLLADHVDRDPHRRVCRSLGAAGLEHVEAAALDRELEVLDVAVMLLELLGDLLELGVGLGHVLGQRRDRGRSADARDDVLALGVDQVLAKEDLLAGVGVAGEGDAGARVVAHVAEDHGHDVDGGAEVVGDLLAVAVVVGALAEPGREDGLDGQVQLLVRVVREGAAHLVLDDLLVRGDELLEVGDVEIGVLGILAVGGFGGVERLVEPVVLDFLAVLVLGQARRDVEDDAAEHRDEATVRIPAEALVAGEDDEALEGRFVEPEVKDGVHHARH